jgi:transcription initiation factor IIE alpha subunit
MNSQLSTPGDPSAPWNENNEHLFECRACKNVLNKGESGDPIIIDGEPFCDRCASDLTQLRFDETISSVSEKTKRLVKAVDERNYQLAWEELFHKIGGKVRHI